MAHPNARQSVLNPPHRGPISKVCVQRAPWGDGVAYHILADGSWLGTLSDDEGREFVATLYSLPKANRDEYLHGVAAALLASSAKPAAAS